jgi:hypothetical protein
MLNEIKKRIEDKFKGVSVEIHDMVNPTRHPKDGAFHVDIFSIPNKDLSDVYLFIENLQNNYIYATNQNVCFHPWTESETQTLLRNEEKQYYDKLIENVSIDLQDFDDIQSFITGRTIYLTSGELAALYGHIQLEMPEKESIQYCTEPANETLGWAA